MVLSPDVQGDPGAIRCRWCNTGRRRHRDTLVCPSCDPDPTVWNDTTKPEPLAGEATDTT